MQSRREFIKLSCGICAAITGAGLLATSLQGCTSIPLLKAATNNGKIVIDESSFGKSQYVLVRPTQSENDILVVRQVLELTLVSYHSLLMQCTHQQQPLNVSGKIIHCPAHGSEFDLQGNVKKDPALLPLKKYETSLEQGKITIDLNS